MGLTALIGAESVSRLTELMPFQLLKAPTLAPVLSAVVTSGLAKKSPLLPLRACEPPPAEGAGLARAEDEVLILAGMLSFCFCGL